MRYETNRWYLTKEQVDWMIYILNECQPRNICELGCGVSTCVFLDYQKEHNGVSILSFEHDPDFVFHGNTVLCGLEYTEKSCRYAVFDKILPKDKRFDLVLIDAPYSFDQNFVEARVEMLDFVRFGLLSDRCAVIIHDSQRPNVIRTMEKFEKKLRESGYQFSKEDDNRKDKLMTFYRIMSTSR